MRQAKTNPLNRYIRYDKISEAKLRRCARTKGGDEFVVDVMRRRAGYGHSLPQCPSVRYR